MTLGVRLVAALMLAAAGAPQLTAADEHTLILEGTATPAGGGAIMVDGQLGTGPRSLVNFRIPICSAEQLKCLES